MVHLWGKTGAGKSAALMVAASVWGNPDGKLFGTMNGTLNFFQSQASMLRNIPLFLDELQTVRESDGNYDKLIMQLGVGVGRGRADRTGAAKRTVQWRNGTLCTGEEPIIRPNSGGGTVNRLLYRMVSGFDRQAVARAGRVLRIGIPTVRTMRKRRQRTHGHRNHRLFHFDRSSVFTMWNKHVNYTLPPAVLSTTHNLA